MRDQLDALDTRIGERDRQITAQQADDPLAKRARDLPGVGLTFREWKALLISRKP